MMPNMVTETFTGQMLALYTELERISNDFSPMPDDAMDHLRDAASVIRETLIDAPITCEGDVANKLRLAAILIEIEGVEMNDEMPTIVRASEDLAAWRNAEWIRYNGRPHPWYGDAS
ncbi:MAG: hypothetical protein JWM58_3927 [Rhizobium sp.]|nr:hypothetical protein [Rhizobium sp.]